jgi:hypothetical protein
MEKEMIFPCEDCWVGLRASSDCAAEWNNTIAATTHTQRIFLSWRMNTHLHQC